jgi:hypothetical protein
LGKHLGVGVQLVFHELKACLVADSGVTVFDKLKIKIAVGMSSGLFV